MDIYNHSGYSEWIARHLVTIGRTDRGYYFLRNDEVEEISDLEGRISPIRDHVLVVIDGLNLDFSWLNDDNPVSIPQYFIVLLKQCKAGNVDGIHFAKAECKDLFTQIVCQTMLDWNEECNGLQLLELNSMTFRGIGSMRDNFYGVMLGFNLRGLISLSVD